MIVLSIGVLKLLSHFHHPLIRIVQPRLPDAAANEIVKDAFELIRFQLVHSSTDGVDEVHFSRQDGIGRKDDIRYQFGPIAINPDESILIINLVIH